MANFWWGGGAVEWPLWKVNKGCPSSSQPWNMVLTAEHSWAHQPFWWCLWETYLRTKNTDEEQTGREWGEDRKGGGGGNNTVRAIGDALLCLGRYRPKGSTAHGEPTWDLRKRVRNMELQKETAMHQCHPPAPPIASLKELGAICNKGRGEVSGVKQTRMGEEKNLKWGWARERGRKVFSRSV